MSAPATALDGAAWARHRAALRRFVARRVADRHEAEDVVQDTLLRGLESMHQLDAPERLPAWLARIAAHRIVDLHRARRPQVELPDDLRAAEPEHDPLGALAPCVPAMVERLPDTYRDALRWSELEGLPQQAVADRLGLSLSGAKSRVQRGRDRLRERIERCCRVRWSGAVVDDLEPRSTNACASERSLRLC